MANRNAYVVPTTGSGGAIRGEAKTATFTSDGFSLITEHGSRFQVWVDVTATGTSETLDITPEYTMDNSTWIGLPATANSTTAAAMTQITDTGALAEWWEVGLPFADDTANYKMRLVFTIAGTNPSFTFNEVKCTLLAAG